MTKEQMLTVIRDYYNLKNSRVLEAMSKIPRKAFVPNKLKNLAYADQANPIGFGQTISQPYTVAYMTDLLNPQANEIILEIGTGSGYQAAILSLLCQKVYSVERIKPLALRAQKVIKALNINNVYIKQAQGEFGWQEHAPFDAILITAELSSKIPAPLINQLKDNGRIITPLDGRIVKFIKKRDSLSQKQFGRFSFVPFIER